MLTVSLHKVAIDSANGLYDEELVLGNHFEVDLDVCVLDETCFVDYTVLNQIVLNAFSKSIHTLEGFAEDIWSSVAEQFHQAKSIKVSIRKYHPPMPGTVGYAQVVLER